MTEQDKPLHVRVAEALGCKPECNRFGRWVCGDPDWEHGDNDLDGRIPDVPRYDSPEWVGPLMERYGISVRLSRMPFDPSKPWTAWAGASDVTGENVAHGASPAEAVCHLILALAEAGKLQRETKWAMCRA